MTVVEVTGTPVTVDADGTLVDVAVDNSPVTVEADGSVAVAVEQVDVTVATSGSSVPVTVEPQTVAVSVPVARGVPDDPFTEVDLTGDLRDLFGGTINLGTNGVVKIRYQRVGRMVSGFLYIAAADDATYGNGGPLYIAGTDLPYAPKAPPTNPVNAAIGWGSAGNFGFFTGASFVFGASPSIVPLGVTAMAFTKTTSNSGGLASIVSDSSPENLDGIEWSYSGSFSYEADTAA